MLMKVDATMEENTNFLEATLKGDLGVPTAIIDNMYVVRGDANFMHRLTYTLQLAENMPATKEDEQRWLLKK